MDIKEKKRLCHIIEDYDIIKGMICWPGYSDAPAQSINDNEIQLT